MTVTELIALLHTLPPDARVMVKGYEDGFDNVTGAQLRPVILNGGYRVRDAFGPYSPREDGMEGEHTEASPRDRSDPNYAEVVYLAANRAR